jgi:integrase
LYQLPPKVYIERRNGSPRLYVRAFIDGKSRIRCTGEETLGAAVRKAQEIYLDWMIAKRAGSLPTLPGGPAPVAFETAYESFIAHADRTRYPSEGQRKNYRQKWTLLKRHFDGVSLTDIDRAWLETLRNTRKDSAEIVDSLDRRRARTKPVSNATLKKDFDFIRLVMQHAKEMDKTLDALPQFPSFKGRAWKVKATMRPFLPYPVWKQVRETAKARIHERPNTTNRGNADRIRQNRIELYAFTCMCVGAALRVDEAYSLRWKDCTLKKFDDGTEYVHLWVYGKHADTDAREEGWGLYDAVIGYKLLKKFRPNAKPDDKLFTVSHREGMRLLLEAAGVREDVVSGMTRDSKSLRQTGISMRLELGPDPSYNDIAKWARTSPVQIAKFYDQTHPELSVKRIAGIRKTGDAVLDRQREQMLRESTMDTDDHMGEDKETGDEPWNEPPRPTRASLRIVSRKKR